MTWLASILISRGLSSRLAGILAWLIPAVLLIALTLALWFSFGRWVEGQRTGAVEAHDKDVTIEAANRVIMAERAATANQTANASVFANAQEELRDEAHDKGTPAPVGPGISAVMLRMRQQQQQGRR